MNLFRHQVILGLAAVVAVATIARAQYSPPVPPIPPHIGYVYPAGAQQGATLEVTIGGQNLNGIESVHFSGSGVQAQIVEVVKPVSVVDIINMVPKMEALLRKKGGSARDFCGGDAALAAARRASFSGDDRGGSSSKSAWTAEDEKTLAGIRKKLARFVPLNQLTPAVSESLILKITVAPDAEPGDREVRVGGTFGLSNPLRFCVGQLPEFAESVVKITWDRQQSNPDKRHAVAKREMSITLPATVNGQIMPGGVDQYRFHAHKGQRVVIITHARDLLPYLPDAVPGWFQATLALYDAKGKELAYDDNFRFRPDPVLYYQIPEDGQYTAEIKDALYRGRQDFVYRVSLGELPFITSIFPLGGTVGAETAVELRGWNLPATNLTVKGKAPCITQLSTRREELISNQVPFAVDDLPECREQEPNDLPENAQRVTLPIIVNGRIDHPGDVDVFRIEGHAGEQVVAEVYARRLDSSLDSTLRLTDASGKQLAYNDDYEDKGSGLNTHHADSYLTATLPANGTYYLYLEDAQQQGGPSYAYRLRISAPRPDYTLRVTPSSVSVRGGTSVPITVYALRKDGFTNQIALLLEDAPPGFTLTGGLVPANEDMVRLTLTAPSIPTKEPLKFSLQGRAIVQGKAVVRQAVPAEDMMQAFAYRHLVPMSEMDVAVWSSPSNSGTPTKIYSSTPVKIPVGGTARIQVGMPAGSFFGNIDLELSDPPAGITIEKVSSSRDSMEIVLHSDAAKVKPGLKGNLIINSFSKVRPGSTTKAKKKQDQRFRTLGSLPAIPFEVVAK